MHLIPWAICAVAAIGAGEPVLVDFSASWCGPCRQMEPVVARLEQEGYRVKRVDIDEQRELAAQYRVEAIPCFIMLVDGREVGRLVGSASHAELVALYPPRPAGANASPDRRSLLDRTLPPPPTQAIAAPPVAIPVSNSAPAAPMVAPASFARAAAPAPVAAPVSPAAQPAAAGLRNLRKRAVAPNGTAPNIATAPISASDPIAGCLAASVRLKLDDPTGRSCGSGTVIDALDHEALVLTCGHIFREGKGQGTLTVDFCADPGLQNLPARVVGYDLKSDVGLVSVQTPRRVTAVRVAPHGYAVRQGDAVVSIGCPHGGDATVEPSKVNSLNKYLGPANIQVAGLPIEGRSGGGLFTADGQLIGVCNAADPKDNEGLYAGLASVHGALASSGLQSLIPAGGATPSPATLAAASPAPHAAPVASRAAPVSPAPTPVANVPAAAGANGPKAGSMSAQEQAVLSQIATHGEHAEVVCVIRSLSDPQAKSEIIVLDRASPDFLRQLASEQNVQDARTLTASHSSAAPTPASPSRVESAAPSWKPEWKTPAARK